MYASISFKSRRDQITRIVFDWHNTGSNQFKRKLDTESAICTLCKAPVEDHRCSQPRMVEIRNYHFIQINSKITASLSIIRLPHNRNIIRLPTMLVGRVHSAQQTALSSLPTVSHHSAKHIYKKLVKQCR